MGGPGNGNTCLSQIHPNANNQSIFSAEADKTWSKFTFRAGAEYKVDDNSMAYVTFSQGFKSGGFGPGAANQLSAKTPFNEELAESFEFGYKTDFLKNKARANIAVFLTDYTDLQVGTLDPVSGALTIENAGEAETKGFELELTLLPVQDLTLNINYAYVDSEYTDFGSSTGNELRTPKNSGSLSAIYYIDLDGGSLSTSLNYNYKSDFNQFANGDPRAHIPSRGIVNARMTYRPNSGVWSLSLWGKNVTDEEEIFQVVPPPASIGSNLASAAYGAPATFGITLGVDF
jgi:iron complex outermembrane receptor protein